MLNTFENNTRTYMFAHACICARFNIYIYFFYSSYTQNPEIFNHQVLGVEINNYKQRTN